MNGAANEHTNQNQPFQSPKLLEICPLIPFCMIKMSSPRLEGTAASFSFCYALLINSRFLVTQRTRCCPCESQHREMSRRVEQRSTKPVSPQSSDTVTRRLLRWRNICTCLTNKLLEHKLGSHKLPVLISLVLFLGSITEPQRL